MKATIILAAVAALGLAGCAAMQPVTASYVAPVTPTDTMPLVQSIASFVGDQLPVGRSTLLLEPPPANQQANTLTPALTTVLHARGYAIAADAKAAPSSHHVRYLVTPLFDGILVRVNIDKTEGSRMFQHDKAGNLVAYAPMAVRNDK
jgi:hypothetical protein